MKKLLILLFCFSFGFINAQQTIEIPIINGNDDAFQYHETDGPPTGTMFLDTDSLAMGFTYEPYMFYQIGLRYQSVPIPPGSTIESAYIQFTGYKASTETHSIWIYCEKNPNPPVFTAEDFNISNRQVTYNFEWWGVSEWQVWIQDDNAKTHDIKDLVQEVIDLEGWIKNNPLVFIFKGDYPTHGELFPKVACSYEYGSEWYAPILAITFTAPAAVEEQDLVKALNIFPNPVTDMFSVSLTDIEEGVYSISIYDLRGKQTHQLYEGTLVRGDHKFDHSARDLNLQAGVYLLSVRGNKQDVIRKVIIQ